MMSCGRRRRQLRFPDGYFFYLGIHPPLTAPPVSFFRRYMLELFHAPPDHWIHLSSSGDVIKSYDGNHSEVLELSNARPILGHVMERLFTPMFGCFHTQGPAHMACMVDDASPGGES